MILAILAVCLAAQAPEELSPVQRLDPYLWSDTQRDWCFRDAVENSVIGFIEDGEVSAGNLVDLMPDPIGVYVRAMECDHWKCRDQASSKMRKLGDAAVTYLFWGLRSHDKEVWLRCDNILRSMARCQCSGMDSPYSWCNACNGHLRCWPVDPRRPQNPNE